MNRIEEKLQQLKRKKEKALVTFVTAGDPDLETTIELVLAMEKAGSDIIELGIPYSDPLADGEVIQESSLRALKAGTKINKVMETVKKIRTLSNVPILYLLYYNSIFKYGVEKFLIECRDCGVDGLIIPDLPIEEREEVLKLVEANGIILIPMVAPTSEDRISSIVKGGQGFVYCVSVAGVTGVRANINTDIDKYMDTVAKYTEIPKMIGFGISNEEMIKKYKDKCDGLIIGSALVKTIASENDKSEGVKAAYEFISRMKKAIL